MLGLLPKCPRLVVHSTFPVDLSISPAHERSPSHHQCGAWGSPFGADRNNPVSLTPYITARYRVLPQNWIAACILLLQAPRDPGESCRAVLFCPTAHTALPVPHRPTIQCLNLLHIPSSQRRSQTFCILLKFPVNRFGQRLLPPAQIGKLKMLEEVLSPFCSSHPWSSVVFASLF